MATVEVLAILAIWMAIRRLRSKHTRQRKLRECTVKCVSACDVIFKLDLLQSGSKIEMNPHPISGVLEISLAGTNNLVPKTGLTPCIIIVYNNIVAQEKH